MVSNRTYKKKLYLVEAFFFSVYLKVSLGNELTPKHMARLESGRDNKKGLG